MARAGQRRLQPVVVRQADGIELVVMAAGTVDREPKKRLPHGPDHVLKLVLPGLQANNGVVGTIARLVVRARNQETRRRDISPVSDG